MKWYKLIALLVLIPLAGCDVEMDEEEAIKLVEAELATELTDEQKIEMVNAFETSQNGIDLLPNYVAIEIQWEDLADNEDGFLIERSNSETGEFTLLTSLETNQTSYVDEKVKQGSTYCYRIGAFNDVGTAYSEVSCKNS